MVSVWGERVVAVIGALLAVYMMRLAWSFPAGGHLFPVFACGAMIAVSILMVVRTFVTPALFEKSFPSRPSREIVIPLIATVATILYVLMIFRVGYYTSTLLYLVIFSLAAGVKNRRAIALTVIITLPLMYAFFELFLQARLPQGWLI